MTENETVVWHHQLDGNVFEQALGVGDEQRSLVCSIQWSHKYLDHNRHVPKSPQRPGPVLQLLILFSDFWNRALPPFAPLLSSLSVLKLFVCFVRLLPPGSPTSRPLLGLSLLEGYLGISIPQALVDTPVSLSFKFKSLPSSPGLSRGDEQSLAHSGPQ